MERRLCIWWDQKRALYYELLKPGDRCLQQLIKLNQALNHKRPESGNRTHKVLGWQLSSDTLHIFVYFNFLFIYSNTLIDIVITRWLDYLCPSVWQTFNPALPKLRFLMLEEVIHCVFDILRIVERRSSIVEIIGSLYSLFILTVRKLPKASTFYHT